MSKPADVALRHDLPSLRGQRVLVTGGLGFVGSNLVHACLRLGAEVSIYDCLDPRSGGNLANVEEVQDDVEVMLGDIRNFEGLCSAVLRRDIVFHCAAYTSNPNSMREPLIDIDVNCKGTIHLLEAARRFNDSCAIVHVGTATQVGRMRRQPVDEEHPEFPTDVYSASKTAAEKYALVYGQAYGMRTTVVRLANVYGPRSHIRSPDFGFLNYFVGLALQGRELPVFGDGAHVRNISFVDDVVAALVLASRREDREPQVLFAVSDEQLTVRQAAEAVSAAIGGSVSFVPWPPHREAAEIGDAVISNARARAALGWQPRYLFREGLQMTGEFYRPRLRKYV